MKFIFVANNEKASMVYNMKELLEHSYSEKDILIDMNLFTDNDKLTGVTFDKER